MKATVEGEIELERKEMGEMEELRRIYKEAKESEERRDVHLKVPLGLLEDIDYYARQEGMNRTTFIIFLLRLGMRYFLKIKDELKKGGGK